MRKPRTFLPSINEIGASLNERRSTHTHTHVGPIHRRVPQEEDRGTTVKYGNEKGFYMFLRRLSLSFVFPVTVWFHLERPKQRRRKKHYNTTNRVTPVAKCHKWQKWRNHHTVLVHPRRRRAPVAGRLSPYYLLGRHRYFLDRQQKVRSDRGRTCYTRNLARAAGKITGKMVQL